MAGNQDDFLVGDDLDAVFELLLEEDFFEDELNFDIEVAKTVSELPTLEKELFKCSFCAKTCISKRGLTRHTNSKHSNLVPDIASSSTTEKSLSPSKEPEQILHPLKLKKFLQESAEKLAVDECYPHEIMAEFKNYQVGSPEDVVATYGYIRQVIKEFNGDAEKFYPKFYKCINENHNIFPGLSRYCSILLGYEVANNVLAHLSGCTFNNDVVTFTHDSKNLTLKERSIVCYLGGYVFSTIYKRIRFSKKSRDSAFHQQCLAILLAGKCDNDDQDLVDHELVNIHCRNGSLWKVTKDTLTIFLITETIFLDFTVKQKKGKHLDSKEIVSYLMKNCSIVNSYSKVRNNCSCEIKNEIALNLLEDLLMLYIRLRTFSFVKQKHQLHKLKTHKNKSKSLRTEIKKKSMSLDQGH